MRKIKRRLAKTDRRLRFGWRASAGGAQDTWRGQRLRHWRHSRGKRPAITWGCHVTPEANNLNFFY